MSRNVKTTCEVQTVEDGEKKKAILVHSHVLFPTQVTLEIDGKKVTVYAADLKQAVDRCSA
jgi:hypothetical protein